MKVSRGRAQQLTADRQASPSTPPAPAAAPEPLEVRNGRAYERRLFERAIEVDPLTALLAKEGIT